MLIGAIKGAIKKNPAKMHRIFEGQGDNFYFAENINDPKLKDVNAFIQTNLIKKKFFETNRDTQYKYILDSGKPKLVMESPMFRSIENNEKNQYYRLGWNSYMHHEANYCNQNSPSDRWNALQNKHKIKINDWKSHGRYILFLCQKEGDSSLNDLYEQYDDYWDWVSDTIIEIQKYTDRTILIRPHIRQIETGVKRARRTVEKFKNVKLSKRIKFAMTNGGEGLEQDLSEAWCSITYNSLSSVESVMNGTPVINLHKGSMTYPVGGTSIANIESLKRDIDISQWLYDSAYTQWTGKEIENGTAWAHLKPGYNK